MTCVAQKRLCLCSLIILFSRNIFGGYYLIRIIIWEQRKFRGVDWGTICLPGGLTHLPLLFLLYPKAVLHLHFPRLHSSVFSSQLQAPLILTWIQNYIDYYYFTLLIRSPHFKEAAWLSGQRVGLAIRKPRVRVPLWTLCGIVQIGQISSISGLRIDARWNIVLTDPLTEFTQVKQKETDCHNLNNTRVFPYRDSKEFFHLKES